MQIEHPALWVCDLEGGKTLLELMTRPDIASIDGKRAPKGIF